MYTRISLTTVFLFIIGTSISFGQHSDTEKTVIKMLNSFQKAIVENDVSKAEELLSNSARILEGGNIETKEEYLSNHFHSDGKFLSTMNREVDSQIVTIEGNTAWVSTQTHMWGKYSDRKLDLSYVFLSIPCRFIWGRFIFLNNHQVTAPKIG